MAIVFEDNGAVYVCSKASSVPAGVPYIEVDELPDRFYRNAWAISGGTVVIDPNRLRDYRKLEIKQEGLARINAVFPAIDDIDQLHFHVEFWLSIAPAARQPTANFQLVSNIYTAAKDAIQFINTATDQQVMDYNAATDPAWP